MPVVDTVQLHSVVVRVTRREGTHQQDDCGEILACVVELQRDRPLKSWAVEKWQERVNAGKVVIDERPEEVRRGEGVACLYRFLGADFPLIKRIE